MKHLLKKKVGKIILFCLLGWNFALVNAQDKEPIIKLEDIKSDSTINREVYTFVEQQPQFPGGEKKLDSFIKQNIHYPNIDVINRVQGRVIIRFIIDKSGKVIDPKVIRSVSPTLDAEALRVTKLLPDFISGKQHGQNVSVYYTLPFSFTL
jgi:protein TonB